MLLLLYISNDGFYVGNEWTLLNVLALYVYLGFWDVILGELSICLPMVTVYSTGWVYTYERETSTENGRKKRVLYKFRGFFARLLFRIHKLIFLPCTLVCAMSVFGFGSETKTETRTMFPIGNSLYHTHTHTLYTNRSYFNTVNGNGRYEEWAATEHTNSTKTKQKVLYI